MSQTRSYSYPRYLNAKRTVDDRALNQRVWNRFVDALADHGEELSILEVGGGVGATFKRVLTELEEGIVERVDYTLVDRNDENLSTARSNIEQWASSRGYRMEDGPDGADLRNGPMEIRLQLRNADLFDYTRDEDANTYHAVIAQAVADLLDLEKFLLSLRPLLQSKGLWYLPIHFDGLTAFEPTTDPDIDDRIVRLYHESMSEPDEEGGRRARTGRRLLTAFRNQGDALLDAGSSDWIVVPKQNGYPADEAYFLHHILWFMEEELTDHPRLEQQTLSQWIDIRRRQIKNAELIFVAHQLDVLAQTR